MSLASLQSDNSLSIIVTTSGRDTLPATLDSLRLQSLERHDEVLLVCDGPWNEPIHRVWKSSRLPGRMIWLDQGPHHDWGHTPRNRTMAFARCTYLLHLDDDDLYAPGAVSRIRAAICKSPGAFFLFQMRYVDGAVLWNRKEIAFGNVGTPMIAHPREAQFGTWGSGQGGDYEFIRDTLVLNAGRGVCWIPEVIVHIRPASQC